MPTAAQRSYKLTGSKPRLFREAASNASVHMALQKLDGSGNAVDLIADDATFDTTTGTLIVGCIGRDGLNAAAISTRKNCPISVCSVDTIIELPFWSATPTNCEQQDLIEGVFYGIKKIGKIYAANADVTGATGALVCVGKYQDTYAATDQFVMGMFKFVPSVLAFKS